MRVRPALPLKGIRLLDFTIPWAGALAAGYLARMGAEVVMIEPPFKRMSTPEERQLRDLWAYSLFCDANKKSIMVNLKDPSGPELVRQLVAVSDVVLENYGGPGVMERLGLGYETLAAINPRLIYCGMPAMGMTGPEKDYIGYGVAIEQLAGAVALQGYSPDDSPYKSGINYGDPIAAMTATGAILLALYQRRQSGRGQLVDLSQRESMAMVLLDVLMDASMNGRYPERMGNHESKMAPHNVYRANGDDAWAMIACRDDDDWRRLAAAIGRPELAADLRFATAVARKANEAGLDRIVGTWVGMRTPLEVQEQLQAAGIPAARVAHVEEVPDDAHVRARGTWGEHFVPSAGETYPLSHSPWLLRRLGPHAMEPAPYKGQDTDYVLRLAGREGERQALIDEGVVGAPESFMVEP